ncbi:hypothetical protein J4P41_13770 [Gluconobacter sp. NFX36]|uniref:hypothetical protein n=1 Tax=unclassified Gluconobacter TaxID=2644261 RepID=UPI0031F9B729
MTTYFPLGTNCTLAFNLKRAGLQKETGLLDNFITSYSSLLYLFERKFHFVDDNFGDYLELIPLGHHDSVIHRPSGLILHHAFERNSEGYIKKNWKDDIEKVRSKYTYLSNRMNQSIINSRDPIFVIHGEALNGEESRSALLEYQFNISQSQEVIKKIILQARKSYERYLRFSLLSVRENMLESANEISGVYIDNITYHGDWYENNPMHFGGCVRGWDEGIARMSALDLEKSDTID